MKYSYKKRYLVLFFMFFDVTIGFIISLFLNKKLNKDSIKKIAILNPGHLGDMVLMSGLIGSIKVDLPEVELVFVCGSWANQVVELFNVKKTVLNYDGGVVRREKKSKLSFLGLIKKLKKTKPDVAIITKGDPIYILATFFAGIKTRIGFSDGGFRGMLNYPIKPNLKKHQIDNLLSLLLPLEIIDNKNNCKLNIGEFSNLFSDNNLIEKKYIVIQPGAGYSSKLWPTKHWKKLARLLLDNFSFDIVIVGSDDVDSVSNEVLQLGSRIKRVKKSIKETAFLISKSILFIGLDSVMGHITNILSIPQISIFSLANNPKRWAPLSPLCQIVTHDVDCKYCEFRVCPKNNLCMNSVLPETIFNISKRIINEQTI